MKKNIGTVLILCLLPISILLSAYGSAAAVERITAQELNAKLCSTQVVILDLRDSELWEKSKIKIKCSRRVDPEDLSSWVVTLPFDKEIILYCCS
jgi:rhodanese-related sulfurtransferase